jgi:hypothetical protein
MVLVTRLLASSEQAWEPMASSSVNFCRKTRTVREVNMCLPVVCRELGLQCGDRVHGQLCVGNAGLQCDDARGLGVGWQSSWPAVHPQVQMYALSVHHLVVLFR